MTESHSILTTSALARAHLLWTNASFKFFHNFLKDILHTMNLFVYLPIAPSLATKYYIIFIFVILSCKLILFFYAINSQKQKKITFFYFDQCQF